MTRQFDDVTLLRNDGVWLIVNKVFFDVPRAAV